MFSNITWTDYIIVVILLLTIYYILIGIRFYFHKLKDLAGKPKNLFRPVHNEVYNGPENNRENELEPVKLAHDQNYFAETSDEVFQQVEHLMGRAKIAIEEASGKEHSKEELALNLRLILNEYPELKDSPYPSSINEIIISECARYGSVMLGEDEIVMLWNDA